MKNTSRLVQAGVALALTAGLAVSAQAYTPSPLNAGTGTTGAPGNAFATGGSILNISGSGNNYTFSMSGSLGSNAALEFPGTNVSVTGASINLTGTLTHSGVGNPWALGSGGGTETITGTIAACTNASLCGGQTWGTYTGTLFSAKLTSLQAFTPSSGGDYLGFKTSFAGTSSWMLTNNINQGSTGESIYLYALTSTALSTSVANNSYFNSFVSALSSGASLGSGTVQSYVGSYSTVPLPLSGLLLTSGLAGLGLMARRKIGVAA